MVTKQEYCYCYECGNNRCKYYWFSKESDLDKIKGCPECGEAENIKKKEIKEN